MQAYCEGDLRAFEELYQRCRSKVFGYLVKRTSSKTMAEEIFQSSFLKLHEMRARYQVGQPFLPWLFVITKSVWIDRLRKDASEARKMESFKNETPSEFSETQVEESSHKLKEAIEHLPLKQQELLRLRYEEGLSFEEIGRNYKMNESAVRQSISRLTRKLKELVKGSHHEN